MNKGHKTSYKRNSILIIEFQLAEGSSNFQRWKPVGILKYKYLWF